MSDRPVVISLFSGMGGLDIGARAAGLSTSLAVDLSGAALQLLEGELDCPTMTANLAEVEPAVVAERAGYGEGDPLLIIGGPPCTGFSHAGFWLDRKRNGSDPAVGMLARFGDFVSELRPRAFLLENVPGVTFKNFKDQLAAFTDRMSSLRYALTSQVLNAADFGVPQERRRFFIVGLSDGDESFSFPAPCFPEPERRTAKWAFADLCDESNPPEDDEVLRGKYSELLPKVPQGDNYLFFTEERGHPKPRFKWRSRYWSFLKKLAPDQPSNTVPATRVTNNGPFHWDNRHLRIREMARLQGFPDSIPLEPSEEHRRFVGNAVPPALGAAVLSEVVTALKWGVAREERERLERLFRSEETAVGVSDALTDGKSERSNED